MTLRPVAYCLLSIALFIPPSNARTAEIYLVTEGTPLIGGKVAVRGDIEPGDYERLTSMLKKSGHLTFWINSRGGNLAEATKIGRFVRSSLITVVASEECWSACALILAGVADPTDPEMLQIFPFIDQVVALHRPYLDPDMVRVSDYESIEKAQLQILEGTKQYLLEMGVDSWVYEKMITKSSQDAWWLKYGEEKQVFSKSVAYEEWIIANCPALPKSEDHDAELITYVERLKKHFTPELMHEILVEMFGQSWRIEFDSFSSGYKSYVSEKSSTFAKCKRELIKKRHQEVLANLQ